MPSSTRFRGPQPGDRADFSPSTHATLRRAAAELSWLLEREYNDRSALKFVGDRYQLTRRQRLAVGQSSCADRWVVARQARRLTADALAGRSLRVDGFNCVITLEAALSGALILEGHDGVLRDLSRLRGSYRPMAHTERALGLVGELLADVGCGAVEWCLDRPVSNSGRLRGMIVGQAENRGWPWSARLTDSTDREIAAAPDVAVTSDSWILDQPVPWIDLAGTLIRARIPDAWILRLRPE